MQSPVRQGTPCCYATRKSLRHHYGRLLQTHVFSLGQQKDSKAFIFREAVILHGRLVSEEEDALQPPFEISELDYSCKTSASRPSDAAVRNCRLASCGHVTLQEDTDICVLTEQTVGELFYIHTFC